ncbi:alpha-glucosidase-like isoform X2 [Diachasmimorpha longicaudata]|uniref:alpha-glucosidase-like isoform X2 n=1 Tax=Diachasmimorpha longicaudata TaxID=58733 RepID=UPI0030B885A2
MASAELRLLLLAFFLAETGCGTGAVVEWWRNSLIYQIAPLAFQDSDGDGKGDLKGIIQRLDYLHDLGVGTICLNPIYPSPMIADGFDVSNYRDINPLFGDMEDFHVLVEEAHQRGLKVILDIVPNHSSNEHSWFNASIHSIPPYTDYYVWAAGRVDANGTRQPPNDWRNFVGGKKGSAWTWNEIRGEWYYHQYLPSQPDLNLRNAKVVTEILNIIDFWLVHGVDGFFISDVPYLFEDLVLKESPSGALESGFHFVETSILLYQILDYTNIWADVNNSTSKLVMAEAWDLDKNVISKNDGAELLGTIPLNFRLFDDVEEAGNAAGIKAIVEGWLKKLPVNWTTNWVLSAEKYRRIANLVGQKKLPGYLALSMLLPGQACMLFGDEIGMIDSKAPSSDNLRRTPMQWSKTTSAGFSTNSTTYVPVNDNYDYQNVETQLDDPKSTLNVYKSLVSLKKIPVFRDGDWQIDTLNDDKILVLKRSLEGHPTYIILINTASESETADISSIYPDFPEHLIVDQLFDSAIGNSLIPADRVKLVPDALMVLTTAQDPLRCPIDENTKEMGKDSTIRPENEIKSSTSNVLKDSDDHENGKEPSVKVPVSPDHEENPNDLKLEPKEESQGSGERDVTDEIATDNIQLKIDETSVTVNNFEDGETKLTTTSETVDHTPKEVQPSTTQAPRNNGNDENSSACRNKIVTLVLGLVTTITLVLNYL